MRKVAAFGSWGLQKLDVSTVDSNSFRSILTSDSMGHLQNDVAFDRILRDARHGC
jgi:hypothetical protein